jgi:hypothetical protein
MTHLSSGSFLFSTYLSIERTPVGASPDRTHNSRPFQPAILIRILRQILLVIVCRLRGISTETTVLHRRLVRFGRFPVDVE